MFTDDMCRLKTKLAQEEITHTEFKIMVRLLIKAHVGSNYERPTTLTQKIKKLELHRHRSPA